MSINFGPVVIPAGQRHSWIESCLSLFQGEAIMAFGDIKDVFLAHLSTENTENSVPTKGLSNIPLSSFEHVLESEMLFDITPPCTSFMVTLVNQSDQDRKCGVRIFGRQL